MNATQDYLWQLWRLARGDRPVGFMLLLAPVLWSLWLAASGLPPLKTLAIFIVGTWCMRAAGCVINDMADRHIDPHVQRTRDRPLASQTLHLKDALLLLTLLLIVAFVLVLQTNHLTLMLAPVALLFVVIYPFSKRWFQAPQIFLALSFSFAVPMSFAAIKEQLPAALWFIWLANICWVLAYDTLYAMSDRCDDSSLGVHSTAILLGKWDLLFVAIMQTLALVFLIYCGTYFQLGLYYYLGTGLMALLFVYQQWLARARDPRSCLRAFTNNAIAGMVMALGIGVDFYMRVSI